MIHFEEIKNLLKFHSQPVYTVSMYLNVNGAKFTPYEYSVKLKNLIKERTQELEEKQFSKQEREYIAKDFEKIYNFVSSKFKQQQYRGLVIFSCGLKDFFQVYPLTVEVKDALIVDIDPYIKPLLSILRRFQRTCVVLVDSRKAKIFEVYAGQIEELKEIVGNIPGKIKTAGWKGYEERRISHIQDLVRRHLISVAKEVENLFLLNHFDILFIAGAEKIVFDFESHLSLSLRKKLKGKINLDINASKEEILTKTIQLQQEVKRKYILELYQQILNKQAQGMAVIGIEPVIKALNLGAIDTLLVNESYHRPGSICKKCGHLSVKEVVCPVCKENMENVVDIVDEIIEANIQQDSLIEYTDDSITPEVSIAGILRFKI